MGRLCPKLSKCCPWTEKNIVVLRHFSSLCLCFSRLRDRIKNLIILIWKHPSSGRKPWKHKEHLLNCCCVVSTVLHFFLFCSFSFVCFPLSLSFTPFHMIISDFNKCLIDLLTRWLTIHLDFKICALCFSCFLLSLSISPFFPLSHFILLLDWYVSIESFFSYFLLWKLYYMSIFLGIILNFITHILGYKWVQCS